MVGVGDKWQIYEVNRTVTDILSLANEQNCQYQLIVCQKEWLAYNMLLHC